MKRADYVIIFVAQGMFLVVAMGLYLRQLAWSWWPLLTLIMLVACGAGFVCMCLLIWRSIPRSNSN